MANDSARTLRKRVKAGIVKDEGLQKFFVRAANSAAELTGAAMLDYIKEHFK